MDKTIAWLLENAGPVIKYRTLTELCDNVSEQELDKALFELLAFSETQKRLERLKQQNIMNIHGAKSDCFENALAMVLDLGLRSDISLFSNIIHIDEIINVYENLVSQDRKNIHFCTTMYPFFLRAGFRQKPIIDYMNDRVESIYSFTINKDYDIYDNPMKHKVPRCYQDRPIIKPDLYQNYDFKLPLIYDIVGFIELLQVCTEEIRMKIFSIVEYIITNEYHRFTPFYGIVKKINGYAAMGWDCMLPGYNNTPIESYSMYLQRMDLFSNFPSVHSTNWLKQGIALLDSYKTSRDTYLLPKDYLIEKDRCWLLGNHTKLGEGKNDFSRELESTFWVLKIKNNINKNERLFT